MSFQAVIFDLGGVLIDSPLHAIARYEREQGIVEGAVNRVVVKAGPRGAWSRLERGEVCMETFQRDFEEECAAAGFALSGAGLMAQIAACEPRPRMLAALGKLHTAGLRLAALTNNWLPEGERGEGGEPHALRDHFDVFVESARVGLRKPDPRIYHHVCSELRVTPAEAVFLDDIGRNLKTARQLGMHTIKVEDPDTALQELEQLLGLSLLV